MSAKTPYREDGTLPSRSSLPSLLFFVCSVETRTALAVSLTSEICRSSYTYGSPTSLTRSDLTDLASILSLSLPALLYTTCPKKHNAQDTPHHTPTDVSSRVLLRCNRMPFMTQMSTFSIGDDEDDFAELRKGKPPAAAEKSASGSVTKLGAVPLKTPEPSNKGESVGK